MEILFALVPLSIALIAIAVLIFRWAVKSGQYDDLKGPAHSILFDDDKHLDPTQQNAEAEQTDASAEHREPNTTDKQSSQKRTD